MSIYKENIDWNKCYIKEFTYKGKPRYSILFKKYGAYTQELFISIIYMGNSINRKTRIPFYCYSIQEIANALKEPVKPIYTYDKDILMKSRIIRNEPFWKKIFFVRKYNYYEFAKLYPEYFV